MNLIIILLTLKIILLASVGMDQKSEDSNIEKDLKKAKRPSFRTSNSFYCEIITTDHTQNPAAEEEEQKNTGVLSKTKGFFLLDDHAEGLSNAEFKFRFDNENITFSCLKSAMESIIQQVLEKDKSNIKELQEFLNNLSENKAEDDVHKLVLQFYATFGKLEDPLLLTRRLNQAFQNQDKLKEDVADLVVLKFFHSALAKLPLYSGQCVRAIDLKEDEHKIYQKGSVINWKFFNSSSKGDKPVPPFDQRNTYFYIKSLTGRDISDEGEVLFPPGCNFIVEDKRIEGDKTHIYMKQVEVIFTENIVLWVGEHVSNEDRRFLSKLYGQAAKYHLWIVEKPNAREAIKYMEENLTGYISRSKSFQIIVKPKILQEDIDYDIIAYVNQTLNSQGKICSCYCAKEEGEDCPVINNQDSVRMGSYKNLMEDLQAKFKYKGQHLFEDEEENGLNCESCENSNNLAEGMDFNAPSRIDESSSHYFESEHEKSTRPFSDKLNQSGNVNTWMTSEQNENILKDHCYLESTSQFSPLRRFQQQSKENGS